MTNHDSRKVNNVLAFSKSGPVLRDDAFIDNLSQAIRNDEMCLHYQPCYNMASGKADILESLVRWSRPDAGLFYPEVFIPAAEKNGLIFSLDLWVFEQCCKDLILAQKRLNPHTKIAVNISIQACESIYFAQKIIEVSEQYHVLLADFIFEITAGYYVHDIRKVAAFCETMNNYGAEFSLDNFGTGQSSLINLCELPVKTIKIDQRFIHSIGHSKRSEIIINALVRLAKDSGLSVVAKGIENKEQYWFMQEAACDLLQGFLLCRPILLSRIKPAMLYESVSNNW